MTETDQTIDVIVRGVLVSDNYILLAHTIGEPNTFLPGGHITKGESASDALVREIKEEMGLDAEVGRYLGTVEHAWDEADGICHEVNLVFSISIAGADHTAPVPSKESKIEFIWHLLDRLDDSELEPSSLRLLLPGWLSSKEEHGWASTME